MSGENKCDLLVMDIDNTVFDWVDYYVNCFEAMIASVSRVTGLSGARLSYECKEIFTKENSIEYPFVIQQLPSVIEYYDGNYQKIISDVVSQARDAFLDKAQQHLVAYDGVLDSLQKIRQKYPNLKIAALTDAPRYVAMWKLNKLELLDFFDSIYGLGDPRIPISKDGKNILVSEEILIKHLVGNQFGFSGSVRILPDEYEKPGRRGLKTILMDHDLDENEADRKRVLWLGDNVRKDIGLGNALGVTTVWAKYGTGLSSEIMERLKIFSPEINVHKNISVSTDVQGYNPRYTLEKFSDLLNVLDDWRN